MMSTVLSTTSSNSYIESLEEALSKSVNPVNCLILAHNDSKMIRSLFPALQDENAAMLQASQLLWNSSEGDVAQAIEWALQETKIETLVIVGHSQAEAENHSAMLRDATTETADNSQSSNSELLTALQQHNSRNKYAQKRFADNFRNLINTSVIQSKLSSKELTVYGLYYQEESGVFSTYNPHLDQFTPLVS